MSTSLDALKKLAEDAGIDFAELMAEITPVAAPPAGPRKISLPGRKNLKADKFVCVAEPGTGLAWAGFSWPTFINPATGKDEAVPHKGCGRGFRTNKGLTVSHIASFDDPARYPYGCLSAIVPMHLRKVS